VIGDLPLTPIQQWFFDQHQPDPQHFNQALLLEVRQALDLTRLRRAVDQLLEHHDALRLRFTQHDDRWRQINADVETNPVTMQIDLSALPAAHEGPAIEGVAAALQASLNLATGPIVRVASLTCGMRPGRLLIIIHHLAVDGVSWRVLIEDLQTAYTQLTQGAAIRLPAKTIAFKQWAERLVSYAQSPAVQAELPYWLARAHSPVPRLPVDDPNGANTAASARIVTAVLSHQETAALLQEVPTAYHTQINDVLLTALVQTMVSWMGAARLLIDLEGHGREELFDDLDLTRTVGWFTSMFPVLLELESGMSPGTALKAIKEQLRAVPQRGIGYGVLRYLSADAQTRARLHALPRAEVSFNYFGQFDQHLGRTALFGLAPESTGPLTSPHGRRSHLLELTGRIVAGQLHLNWIYSAQIHQRTTIERLSERFVQILQALIAHCQSPAAGGYTPSDFPGAQLNQADLDRVLAKIGRGGS
jgi:non-ribosomal peptide synthase protein (TIGR01720 family)